MLYRSMLLHASLKLRIARENNKWGQCLSMRFSPVGAVKSELEERKLLGSSSEVTDLGRFWVREISLGVTSFQPSTNWSTLPLTRSHISLVTYANPVPTLIRPFYTNKQICVSTQSPEKEAIHYRSHSWKREDHFFTARVCDAVYMIRQTTSHATV